MGEKMLNLGANKTPEKGVEKMDINEMASLLGKGLNRELDEHERGAIAKYVNKNVSSEDFSDAVEVYMNLLGEAIEKQGGSSHDLFISEANMELERLMAQSEK